ncbi:MAG: CoA-binding protein [Chitinophagales bacterium]|jgi:predicted CoA-binding protein|nr:CoA-binding protein [Chitinophagales bacterium]HNI44144.1 CoA-binding protein [Chitinophagales bacterium]
MKTLVLGASTKPYRYAYLAAKSLLAHQHEIVLIGKSSGEVGGVSIHTTMVKAEGVDTVTMYLRPEHQKEYYHYIMQLAPRRIIFNPGTENNELARLAQQQGVLTEEACTLVLLNSGQY